MRASGGEKCLPWKKRAYFLAYLNVKMVWHWMQTEFNPSLVLQKSNLELVGSVDNSRQLIRVKSYYTPSVAECTPLTTPRPCDTITNLLYKKSGSLAVEFADSVPCRPWLFSPLATYCIQSGKPSKQWILRESMAYIINFGLNCITRLFIFGHPQSKSVVHFQQKSVLREPILLSSYSEVHSLN